MNSNSICAHCGAPLPPDAPRELCPDCLLATALTPGDRIQYFGNYELVEEVGLGGMGIVWRAQQTGLNRTVALKMIRGGMLADADDLRRFHAEAEAAANLQHPNIVAIHEIGEFEGQHYYSMDFVEGKNLAELCDGKPLAARRAAELLATIADAVQFAHQRGILHRDLKPQNVMIDEHGAPRLTDFGLAKRLDRDSGLTQTGAVLGSPSYMATEQAQGRADRVGPHTDVYALGAILYEMLTGRAPFRASTPAETMMRVINDEPASPSKLNAGVPHDLETICLKCLEKDPARRYATARELAEDTGRFLAGEPILARPAGALRKAESWLRRHPFLLGGVAALGALVLAFFALYLAEENAFLRAQQANAALVRQPGPRAAVLNGWMQAGNLVMVGTICFTLFLMLRARRAAAAELFQPGFHFAPQQPVGPPWRTAALGVGLLAVACGFVLLAKIIQAQVWEAYAEPGMYLSVYPLLWFGCWLLVTVMRDYQRSVFGAPTGRLLTAAQAAPIDRLLAEMDLPGAIRLYRRTVPDATAFEAREYVLRQTRTLRAQDPAKFDAAQPRIWEINLRAFLLCLIVQAIVAGLAQILFPPANPGPFYYQAAGGFLFGMAIIAGQRIRGFWKRMLLLVPWVVAMVLGEVIFSRAGGTAQTGSVAFFFGIMFGGFAMISAYTRRRKQPAS